MPPSTAYNEDTLVQQTVADYLKDALNWDESIFAFNSEDYGPGSLLGRKDQREVVLTRYLRSALEKLNPGLPAMAYESGVRLLAESVSTNSIAVANLEKSNMIRNGVKVAFHNDQGEREKKTLRVIDFADPANNHFLCVREMWIQGEVYRRRADIIGFINGLPMLFIECKNLDKNLRAAYDQNFCDYRDTVPHLFHHNAIVLLTNGESARVGTVTSRWEFFQDWKRLAEADEAQLDTETLLRGVCARGNFLDLVENFLLFDRSGSGEPKKILARNHQYLGVNRAIEAVRDREKRDGKLGVFWHTQGSGKSYSMVFLTRKIHRRLGSNFTFLILTDRDDLDTQIYKTFAGCEVVNHEQEACRASSGEHVETLLKARKAYVFSLIQKFHQEVKPGDPWSERDDIIVISDEAHRSQYGELALNLRNALPGASYLGFTGTPLFKNDEQTRRIFGEYVSTYDFQRAVEDGATVPLYYDARGERLGIAIDDLNEKIAEKLEELEIEDLDTQQRLEEALKQDYHVVTADRRMQQIARDFVEHYTTAWESGKAMFVCIDKLTCVKLHGLIEVAWKAKIAELRRAKKRSKDEQESIHLGHQIRWMAETEIAVVVSEEQGEVAKFAKWDLDIVPHRKKIKNGLTLPETLQDEPEFLGRKRLAMDDAFKEPRHPFRVAIVCAMWLTGFDVPCLGALYLDKPLKAHTLMQAIARANRVDEGKNNGLIVDYCGIIRHLRKALATFAGTGDAGRDEGEEGAIEPAKPEEELLEELAESIRLAKEFLATGGARLESVAEKDGFLRTCAILECKEVANQNDESRKRFELIARMVLRKFKACINVPSVNAHRADHEAVKIIAKSLMRDREKADISDIIRELHRVTESAISVEEDSGGESALFDLSKINFDRLKQEFDRSPSKATTVQNLRHAIEERLQMMLAQNPLRTDFQQHYETIVEDYNRNKDRAELERIFEELLRMAENLDEEETRAAREELSEETLALFDLLKKPELKPSELRKIKTVAVELLEVLKAEKLRIDHWRDKESSRDAVEIQIRDFLYSDDTGLPVDSYDETDVSYRAELVFQHIFRAYPQIPSPLYEAEEVA